MGRVDCGPCPDARTSDPGPELLQRVTTLGAYGAGRGPHGAIDRHPLHSAKTRCAVASPWGAPCAACSARGPWCLEARLAIGGYDLVYSWMADPCGTVSSGVATCGVLSRCALALRSAAPATPEAFVCD